jgi:predicted anti-sigma-YlaC factor YlaD
MTRSADPRQWDCPEARIALGVYVLGAIDPAEQALVDAHLDRCDACQAEMAELADLPALLALVSAEEAVGGGAVAEPPAPERTGALATVHDLSAARRQRRRRLARAGAVAAAAVVIAAASFGGVKLAAGPARPPAPVAVQDPHDVVGAPVGAWQTGHGNVGAVTGTVAYRPMGWGTQLAAEVAGLPRNTPCQLWIVERNGTRIKAGSWDTDANEGAVWYPGSAQVAATAIKSFVITIAGRQPVTISSS